MNPFAFICFAVVYLVIAMFLLSVPLVATFFVVCSGFCVLRAVAASADQPVSRAASKLSRA